MTKSDDEKCYVKLSCSKHTEEAISELCEGVDETGCKKRPMERKFIMVRYADDMKWRGIASSSRGYLTGFFKIRAWK